MSSELPLVSICIPTYRAAQFLPATIRSVLEQSYSNFELLIVDDASPDDTASTVAAFDDPRIRFVANASNLGPEGNWNRCLELSRGQYYLLLPQDDLIERDALHEHVAILEADVAGEIALVFGSRLVIDDQGRHFINRGLTGTRAGRIPGAALVRRCIRAGTNIIGEPGNGLIRKSLAERVGGYDADHPYLVDLDFWFRVLEYGDAYYTGKRSSCFRISGTQWSVALGNKQYRDFKDFVEKFAKQPKLGITGFDKSVGLVKAKLNTFGRAVIYRALNFV